MHVDGRSAGISWESRYLDARTHGVPVRIYRPVAAGCGWLVWAHGGSWRAGSIAQWHEPTADLARVSGCTVVSVGYRLAPLHRHPAQLDDVLTALAWAREQAAADGGRLYSTPLEAERLDGLAPAILAVGELDPVIDDVTVYARRLTEAANRVELRVFSRTPHAAFIGGGPQGPSLRHWLGAELRDELGHQKEAS